MRDELHGNVTNLLAQRLDHLFTTVHPKDRGPYTYREVAEAINADAGTKLISATYLFQLRKGQRTQPSHSRLAAIATFFGVDIVYFSDADTARATDERLELLTVLRDSDVRAIATRADGLSEASLHAILGMIENARRIEGLPGPPGADQ